MAQPTITNFFQKRKRLPSIDIQQNSKVLLLEQQHTSKEIDLFKGVESDGLAQIKDSAQKVVYRNVPSLDNEVLKSSDRMCALDVVSTASITKTKSKTSAKLKDESSRARKKSNPKKNTDKIENLPDIRQTFLKQNVAFILKGSLSPKKTVVDLDHKCKDKQSVKTDEEMNAGNKNDVPAADSMQPKVLTKASHSKADEANKLSSTIDLNVEATSNARKELGLMAPKRRGNSDKELSLKEIKSRMTRSAKLAELRESLAIINKGNEKLKDIEKRKRKLDAEVPKLEKFKMISMEVRSPMKESPQKVSSSPSSTPTKTPAYQRFSSLAVAGTPILTLPYNDRCLFEVFRCVDTVVAMFHNRKEIITFKKLKPAVQQMLRRNFMESHLGQIKRIFPKAFNFQQEKCHSFGTSARSDKFELRITPCIDALIDEVDKKDSDAPPMNPSVLLERRQIFTTRLTDRVKDLHEEFLQSLDPPLNIARNKLTRWHPEFDIDSVVEVEADPLPQPPNVESLSTASDVLAKAKNLFSCNQRMEKALQKVSELSMQSKDENSAASIPKTPVKAQISAALKGIPKALLEKVRANQAAKAILIMSRSDAQDVEGTRHSRLPEMARIIRNLFVAEKKAVLLLEVALSNMVNSYREKLSFADLEDHLKLLITYVPGWLEIHEIRKTKYLKMSKNADMSKVMKKLEDLSVEKNA